MIQECHPNNINKGDTLWLYIWRGSAIHCDIVTIGWVPIIIKEAFNDRKFIIFIDGYSKIYSVDCLARTKFFRRDPIFGGKDKPLISPS